MTETKECLTLQEIEAKFEDINVRGAVKLSTEEQRSLAEAEAMNDDTTISLEELRESISRGYERWHDDFTKSFTK